jgi:hypothetical protein
VALLRQVVRVGIATEPAPQVSDALLAEVRRIHDELLGILGQALAIREVDAGSCNGCELEIHALNNPYYNIEGLGIRFVASPRHADLLLVTGPVSRHMEEALRRTFEATPEPRLVVAWASAAATAASSAELRQLRRGLAGDPGGCHAHHRPSKSCAASWRR